MEACWTFIYALLRLLPYYLCVTTVNCQLNSLLCAATTTNLLSWILYILLLFRWTMWPPILITLQSPIYCLLCAAAPSFKIFRAVIITKFYLKLTPYLKVLCIWTRQPKPCASKPGISQSPVPLGQAIFLPKSCVKLCQAWFSKTSCVSIMSQALKTLLLHMVRSPHCIALVWFRLGPCACLLSFVNWLTVPVDTRTAMFAPFS